MVIVNRFLALTRTAAFGLSMVGGAILVFSLVAVLADVAARTLFGVTGGSVDLTFRGSYEIVRYGLLLSMLYALPYALKDGQVIVELFTERLSDRNKDRLAGVYIFFFGLFGFGLSSGLLNNIERANRSGQTSQDFGIPMAYIYYLALIGTVMLGVRGVAAMLEYFTDQRKDRS